MKKRLTKAQKRMMILKDALKQIKIGFLKPEKAGICNLPNIKNAKDNADGQTLLKKLKRNKKNCMVCARGALLLTSVLKFNKLTWGDLIAVDNYEGSFEEGSITDGRLMSFFSAEQLMMMETAFERQHNEYELGKLAYDCWAFYDKYSHPRRRLIAILENAIKNNGIFTP